MSCLAAAYLAAASFGAPIASFESEPSMYESIGCGCAVGGKTTSPSVLAFAFLGLLGLMLRRRARGH